MVERWRARIKVLKQEVVALALAARDPRTSWTVRILALAIVAYALSPIDLIPDFIPVLGLLDELVLLPFALILAIRLIPAEVMAEARTKAAGRQLTPSRAAAVVILAIWLMLASGAFVLLRHRLPDWLREHCPPISA